MVVVAATDVAEGRFCAETVNTHAAAFVVHTIGLGRIDLAKRVHLDAACVGVLKLFNNREVLHLLHFAASNVRIGVTWSDLRLFEDHLELVFSIDSRCFGTPRTGLSQLVLLP